MFGEALLEDVLGEVLVEDILEETDVQTVLNDVMDEIFIKALEQNVEVDTAIM